MIRIQTLIFYIFVHYLQNRTNMTKKNAIPIDLYNFQVKLKMYMVIQEYICKVDKKRGV